MKSLYILLKNIRNLLPYFLLIIIYFFFVNLEARKDQNNEINSEKKNFHPVKKSEDANKIILIEIPVIPFID